MSAPLKNSLWNFILHCLHMKETSYGGAVWDSIVRLLAESFYKEPLDSVPLSEYEENGILEEELSGYRFVAGRLEPLTNPTEIATIEEAIDAAGRQGLGGVRVHLDTALTHFGARPTPDYRNAIKESIAAVESALFQINGAKTSGLKDALAQFEKKVPPLHPAMRQGFLSLYGYTSDEDGIRHAILDESTVGFDEAKFMLVSCSAFVNFLIGKAASAGLLKR